MEIIYGDASDITLTSQKRLLRVVEGQTQATPYAGYLDPFLRNTDGSIRVPAKGDTSPLEQERKAAAFTLRNSLTPGLVLVKTVGENLAVHNGAFAVKAFGLLGQWVGGTFDNVKSTNEISGWRGPDSVYDLLAPGWNDKGLAAAVTAATKTGTPVKLYAGADGRLAIAATVGEEISVTAKEVEEKCLVVAEVIDRISPAVLRFNLVI